MWTMINYQNMSQYIDPDTISVQHSLSDPVSTAAFDVVDVGSQLNVQVGQNVILWDEHAIFFAGNNIIPSPPSINIVVNPGFNSSGANWTLGGTLSATASYPGDNTLTIVFSNTAAGTVYASQITQAGYIIPGQQYNMCMNIKVPSDTTNAQWFMQIDWLDAAQNLISSFTDLGPVSPTNSLGLPHLNYNFSTGATNPNWLAPAGAAFARVYVGAQPTVGGTNSATFKISVVTLEPVWLYGDFLNDGTPVTYPTFELDNGQVNCALMPDGTTSRQGRLFTGTIKSMEIDYSESSQNRTYKVSCVSLEDLVENGALINQSYAASVDTAIINDVISTYYAGMLSTGQLNTASPPSTLQAGKTIDAVTYNDQTFRELLNNLTDTTGFSYFVDPYGFLHYNDTPFDYAAFEITDAPDYVSLWAPIDYSIEYDGTQLRNSVKVIGGVAQVTVQDTFNGDGVTKTFNLTNIPAALTTIAIGGSTFAPTSTNKIGTSGSTDVNGTAGIVALVNKSGKPNPQVIFNTAPASGTGNVLITYIIDRAVVIQVEDADSIALYKRRYCSKVNDNSLTSNASAHTRGLSELSTWAYPVVNLHFKSNSFALPGTSVFFTSTKDGFNRYPFVIQTVECRAKGNAINEFTYEAGVYRPTVKDHLRNAHKAIARNTGVSGVTPIQLIYEIVSDLVSYSDSMSGSTVPITTALYGTATYGFSVFG